MFFCFFFRRGLSDATASRTRMAVRISSSVILCSASCGTNFSGLNVASLFPAPLLSLEGALVSAMVLFGGGNKNNNTHIGTQTLFLVPLVGGNFPLQFRRHPETIIFTRCLRRFRPRSLAQSALFLSSLHAALSVNWLLAVCHTMRAYSLLEYA